jgi:hypothetical protein
MSAKKSFPEHVKLGGVGRQSFAGHVCDVDVPAEGLLGEVMDEEALGFERQGFPGLVRPWRGFV